MFDPRRIRPSWWYCLAVIPVGLCGIAVFVLLLYTGLHELSSRLTQVAVPGGKDFSLQQTGLYMIFLEQPSVLNGKTYPADERTSELFCTVAQQPENRKLTISRPNGNFTYNFSGRSGSSALAFNIQQPGTYHFECHYPSGATEPQAVVAVGTGVAALIFGVVFRGLAALFATIACCAAVSVLIYVLREQSKKNLMREAQREYQAQLARAAQPPFTGIPPAGNP